MIILRKIKNNIFLYIEIFSCYIRYILKKYNKNYRDNNRKILLFIIDGRKLLQLINQFQYSGYDCYTFLPFYSYKKLCKYGRYATLLDKVYPTKKNMFKYFNTVASHDKHFLDSFPENSRKIYLNYKIYSYLNKNKYINDNNIFFYPYLMHKNYSSPGKEKEILSRALTSNRKIAAIYIGNVTGNPKINSYNMDKTKVIFKINTRKEIFHYIIDNFNDMAYMPKDLDTLYSDIESGKLRNKILLINAKQFVFPNNDIYIDLLLLSDFFIQMPGRIAPYTHSIFESMAAGCIPITQLSRFFVPRFEHKANSLLYSALNELNIILQDIINGKYSPSIDLMRNNILNTYNNFYSYQSFKNKLNNFIKNDIKYIDYINASEEELCDPSEVPDESEYK